MNILKIKDPQGNWVDIPALKGDKGDKGDPGISPTIDSTLSQANQAADAKAVGDKIDEITLTIDETLTQSGQVADAKVTGDTLNTKANQNGYYENLNVGVADQLASKNYIEDNEAYTFRPTGNGAKVGTREFNTIVGGSIVWNQGVNFDANKIPSARNGITFTKDGDACIMSGTVDGSYSMSAAGWFSLSESFFLTDDRLNHALLIITKHISGTVTDNAVMLNGGSPSLAFGGALRIGNNRIFKMGGEIGEQHRIPISSPVGTVFDNYKFTMTCFDLTQMFGSTIADYIYELEQAEVGAGVSWFRKYFPNDYYDYNPGELMHVSGVSAHKTYDADENVIGNYPLDSSLTLRGIPKLVNGKLTFNGDIYKPDGTVERRYGTRVYENGDESLSNAITDGTNTVYELETPTTEQAQPYQSPQIIDPYGTEEYVTTSLIPVGHQTQYPEDLRAKIESLPWDFANLIAPVETTYIATQNYTTGSLFIVDNILYKATANIANGGTITPNTNCTATTLAEIIAAL